MQSTSTDKNKGKNDLRSRISHGLIIFGGVCIVFSLALLLLIYRVIIYQELSYLLFRNERNVSTKKDLIIDPSKKNSDIIPVDETFGIVIPKINANAPIVKNVNPYDSSLYQQALTKGVAQASGTMTPDKIGNMFLFAHSSANWYEAQKYNSVFYLTHKLEMDDEIFIFFNDKKYTYKVTQKKIVSPTNISYLYKKDTARTLTLMTCWPPGTTLNRLIVEAELQEK